MTHDSRLALFVNRRTQDLIKRHEGKRNQLYLDTEGVLTGGIGHAFKAGGELSESVIRLLFDEDYVAAVMNYFRLVEFNGLPKLDDVRKAVLVDMTFNLGVRGVMGFQKMLGAIFRGDWEMAADEMLDSKWARQVGSRAVELAKMMRTGKWPAWMD